MKVSKAALLQCIEQATTRYSAQVVEYEKGVKLWQEDQRERWMRTRQTQWKGIRDMITKSLKDGKPITARMFEAASGHRGSYVSDLTFNPNSTPSSPFTVGAKQYIKPAHVPVADLEALKLFLEGSPDEVFSLESLSRLGFKAPAWVFRAAASK